MEKNSENISKNKFYSIRNQVTDGSKTILEASYLIGNQNGSNSNWELEDFKTYAKSIFGISK